ncbi:hypothetical protein DFH09DRAFT_1098405 [Mycena vulgaris]|nr:hypothetical protein DFH09DRAFT_1098405 [Mycena vulgaris]
MPAFLWHRFIPGYCAINRSVQEIAPNFRDRVPEEDRDYNLPYLYSGDAPRAVRSIDQSPERGGSLAAEGVLKQGAPHTESHIRRSPGHLLFIRPLRMSQRSGPPGRRKTIGPDPLPPSILYPSLAHDGSQPSGGQRREATRDLSPALDERRPRRLPARRATAMYFDISPALYPPFRRPGALSLYGCRGPACRADRGTPAWVVYVPGG